MYKIRLTNDAQYLIKKLSFEGSNLLIEFIDKTCEELQIIFSAKANTSTIRQYTETGELITNNIIGFTAFQGVNLSPDGVRTVMLGKEEDVTVAEVSKASGDASMALSIARGTEENTNSLINTVMEMQANLDYIAMETGVEL